MVNTSAVSGSYYPEHAVDGIGKDASLSLSFCSQTVSPAVVRGSLDADRCLVIYFIDNLFLYMQFTGEMP